jgi:SAM-dependent methyltransferase
VTVSSADRRPRGVMTGGYAKDRRRKAHLAFRLKCRALAAGQAYERFRDRTDRPRVLDFGAAEGRTTAELHELLGGRESLGIEYDSELVAMAEDLPAGCRVVRGDVTEPHPEVAPGSFDLVTALAVLEHLDAPERLMQQAHRALRPGGILVATCPAHVWDSISGKLGLLQDEYHEGHFDRARFEACAREAGLAPLVYQRFMFAPAAFLPYLRLPFPPALAGRLDTGIRAIRVLNMLFVNQLFVARRV